MSTKEAVSHETEAQETTQSVVVRVATEREAAMAHNCPDLTGRKSGLLTVIRRNGRGSGRQAMWLCKCDCGRLAIVRAHALRRKDGNNTKSCGCLSHLKNFRHGENVRGQRTAEYRAWADMRARCTNPNVNGNYEPENCRWADWKTQQKNRRPTGTIQTFPVTDLFRELLLRCHGEVR